MGNARAQTSSERSDLRERDLRRHDPGARAAPTIARNPGFDAVGNRALLSLLRSGQLQRKARVSPPGDPREHAADRAADAVIAGARPAHTAHGGDDAADLQRMATEDEKLADVLGLGAMSDALAFPTSPKESAAPSANIISQLSGGRSLDPQTREVMESRFGESFADVRIHTGYRAGETADALYSRAFTVGEDIVFAEGEFAPETTEGRRLLAHELAHVLQQRRTVGGVADASRTEADARDAAHDLTSGGTVSVRERAAPGVVQKQRSDSPALDPVVIKSVSKRTTEGGDRFDFLVLVNSKAVVALSGRKQENALSCAHSFDPLMRTLAIRCQVDPPSGAQAHITINAEEACLERANVATISVEQNDPQFARFSKAQPLPDIPQEQPEEPVPPKPKPQPAPKLPPKAPKATPQPQHEPPQEQPEPPQEEPEPPKHEPTTAEKGEAAQLSPEVAKRLETIRSNLKSFTFNIFWRHEIIQAFRDCSPAEFQQLQDALGEEGMADVFDQLDSFEATLIGTFGPVSKGQSKLTEKRAEWLLEVSRWGSGQKSFMYYWMFKSMPTEEIKLLLSHLAATSHLHDTIETQPHMKELLEQRGIKLEDYPETPLGVWRGIGRGLKDFGRGVTETIPAVREAPHFSYTELGEPYASQFLESATKDFSQELTGTNIARGVASEATFGLSEIPFGIWGAGKLGWAGVVDIASGKPGEGSQKITPVVTTILAILLTRKLGKLGAGVTAGEEESALLAPKGAGKAASDWKVVSSAPAGNGMQRYISVHPSGEIAEVILDETTMTGRITNLKTGQALHFENGQLVQGPAGLLPPAPGGLPTVPYSRPGTSDIVPLVPGSSGPQGLPLLAGAEEPVLARAAPSHTTVETDIGGEHHVQSTINPDGTVEVTYGNKSTAISLKNETGNNAKLVQDLGIGRAEATQVLQDVRASAGRPPMILISMVQAKGDPRRFVAKAVHDPEGRWESDAFGRPPTEDTRLGARVPKAEGGETRLSEYGLIFEEEQHGQFTPKTSKTTPVTEYQYIDPESKLRVSGARVRPIAAVRVNKSGEIVEIVDHAMPGSPAEAQAKLIELFQKQGWKVNLGSSTP